MLFNTPLTAGQVQAMYDAVHSADPGHVGPGAPDAPAALAADPLQQ